MPIIPASNCTNVSAGVAMTRCTPPKNESMRPARPGTMQRDDDVWDYAIFDLDFARNGASELRYVLHYDRSGDADGFATYRFKEDFDEEPAGEVRIKEVWADDPEAYAGLWRYLLDLDLARTFRLWSAPLERQRFLRAAHVFGDSLVLVSAGAARDFSVAFDIGNGNTRWVHHF